jgi:hypothetical protein
VVIAIIRGAVRLVAMINGTRTISYIAEVGGAFVSFRILDALASRLPGIWAILCRLALPILLIPAWRYLAGSIWKFRDAGLVRPSGSSWLDWLWLVSFQSSCLLGTLLVIARGRYYTMLGFLETARGYVNGYHAEYGPFVLALTLFAMVYFAWGGELLCRGLAQGLGTIRSNAATGAVISWISFSALPAALAQKLDYPLFPDAALWGLFALLPGPICEAVYFRNHSLLPLMAARTISTSLALTVIGFYLYWYPERCFSTALPLLGACLIAVVLISALWARRLLPLWRTCFSMLRIGALRGILPGISIAAIIIADSHFDERLYSSIMVLSALTVVLWTRRTPVRRAASSR